LSTSCLVRFTQGKKSIDVYQHSDGYPSWTIPTLEKFLKWNGIRNDDLSYAVANFVTFGKLNHITRFMKRAKKGSSFEEYSKPFEYIFEHANSNLGILHTGFGINDKVLTDKQICNEYLEYIYKVELPENEIESNQESIIEVNVFVPRTDHLFIAGTAKFSTTKNKFIDYSKRLLKEMEN